MIKQDHNSTKIDAFDLINQLNSEKTINDIAKLKSIVFDTPEAEHTKIQLIKEELSSGQYEINNNNIADKLMEFFLVREQAEIA